MKPLSEQNHYEILEISSDAATAEIERAFRLAQSTYADDSLAGYSVFGEGEATAIRERVETAYRVLSDDEARRVYDAELRGDAPSSEAAIESDFAVFEAVEPFESVASFEEVSLSTTPIAASGIGATPICLLRSMSAVSFERTRTASVSIRRVLPRAI